MGGKSGRAANGAGRQRDCRLRRPPRAGAAAQSGCLHCPTSQSVNGIRRIGPRQVPTLGFPGPSGSGGLRDRQNQPTAARLGRDRRCSTILTAPPFRKAPAPESPSSRSPKHPIEHAEKFSAETFEVRREQHGPSNLLPNNPALERIRYSSPIIKANPTKQDHGGNSRSCPPIKDGTRHP